jgi:hypothetical protein
MGWRQFTKLPCGYCKLESLLAAQVNASASEVAAAMKAVFLRC